MANPQELIVGVLALQGDFHAHTRAIERAGGHAVEVRTEDDLEICDGLIIPGGESTTMLKILDLEGLFQPLRKFGEQKPIYGTCAGAILLARQVSSPEQPSLGLADIAVERNAYGRQIHSRVVKIDSVEGELEAVFIRAPIIRAIGRQVLVLATYKEDPVWVECGHHMVTTFHPELTGNSLVHSKFLQLVRRFTLKEQVEAA
jgi:5'-phosphate synthase pdxT subunit